ncbi:CC137 protein, partial [Atractosteus spatula]|nr:CC137 protein [Atractosteus spatula]
MKSKEKMNIRIVKKKKKVFDFFFLWHGTGIDSKPRQAADSLQDLTDIPVPKFRRGKWESEGAYLRRMDQETHHVMFLTKNQIERHPETDEPSERQKSEKKKEFDKIRLKRLLKKKEEKREQKREKEKFTGLCRNRASPSVDAVWVSAAFRKGLRLICCVILVFFSSPQIKWNLVKLPWNPLPSQQSQRRHLTRPR